MGEGHAVVGSCLIGVLIPRSTHVGDLCLWVSMWPTRGHAIIEHCTLLRGEITQSSNLPSRLRASFTSNKHLTFCVVLSFSHRYVPLSWSLFISCLPRNKPDLRLESDCLNTFQMSWGTIEKLITFAVSCWIQQTIMFMVRFWVEGSRVTKWNGQRVRVRTPATQNWLFCTTINKTVIELGLTLVSTRHLDHSRSGQYQGWKLRSRWFILIWRWWRSNDTHASASFVRTSTRCKKYLRILNIGVDDIQDNTIHFL